jgi:glucose dehydrogenase
VRLSIFGAVVSFVLLTALGASGSGSKSVAAIPDFTPAQLAAPARANWPLENGNLQSWRYSTLNQINASNGGSLKLARWRRVAGSVVQRSPGLRVRLRERPERRDRIAARGRPASGDLADLR